MPNVGDKILVQDLDDLYVTSGECESWINFFCMVLFHGSGRHKS
jgi:hypothetical protein